MSRLSNTDRRSQECNEREIRYDPYSFYFIHDFIASQSLIDRRLVKVQWPFEGK